MNKREIEKMHARMKAQARARAMQEAIEANKRIQAERARQHAQMMQNAAQQLAQNLGGSQSKEHNKPILSGRRIEEAEFEIIENESKESDSSD